MPSEKVYEDPVLGAVLLRRGRARRISIRVHPRRGVVVTVPWLVPYVAGIRFLEARREWVLAALRRQRDRLEAADAAGNLLRVKDPAEAARLRALARPMLPPRVAYYASRYGFTYGKVFLKANCSNWGSCSSRGNINLNIALADLPEPLRDYVILHELCHLRHRDHGPQFHTLLESLCLDALGFSARTLEKQLKSRVLC